MDNDNEPLLSDYARLNPIVVDTTTDWDKQQADILPIDLMDIFGEIK